MIGIRQALGGLIAAACLIALTGASVLAGAGDADGLNLDEHAGPPVWIEEHWDVKPDKYLEFLAAYDAEIYSLARRTPGYRGYTVATIQPPVEGEAKIVCDPANKTFIPVVGCRLGAFSPASGRLGTQFGGRDYTGQLTERMINWDALFQHAFTVLIIHHLNSWPDADKFRERMAALYAAEHKGGDSFDDHITKTLYKLATVYWTADYRLMATSWQSIPHKGPRKPTDADGLNFDPIEGPGANQVLVSEHWWVPPEKFQAFMRAYLDDVMPPTKRVTGFRGVSIATAIPPQDWEKNVALMTPESLARLGGADALYTPRPGVTMDGAVRTDIGINAGALYKKTFNVIVRHQLTTWETVPTWSKGAPGGGFSEIYAREHDGADFNDMLLQRLFPNADNHWDSLYRFVKSSFVPDAPGR